MQQDASKEEAASTDVAVQAFVLTSAHQRDNGNASLSQA